MIRAFLILLWCVTAHAATDAVRLESLRSLLVPMRQEKAQKPDARGATPALTEVKHQLRDWVEERMKTLDRRGDTGELQAKFNRDLRAAGLVCGWNAGDPRCPDWWQLGYLSDIEFQRSGGFLTLVTRVGIMCGFDDSAYLYAWSESEGWRRVWQNEQNSYTEEGYLPQNIVSIRVSPTSQSNDYLVLTLGARRWCSSAWHEVYYRVFRPGLDPEARPLIDGREPAFLGFEPVIEGSVTADSAVVEFRARSIDGGLHNRSIVRSYSIDHSQVKRVEPLALGPRDFVEEWLTHQWGGEVGVWSVTENRAGLREVHRRLHQDFVAAHEIFPTMHCPATPDVWQVSFDFSDPPTPLDKPPVGTYFLVRWRPPYRFTMVEVSNKPNPNCTEKDPDADDPRRTLFPIR